MDFELIEVYGDEFKGSIKRIAKTSTISGLIVTNGKGNVLFTNMDNNRTPFFANKVWDFVNMARCAIKRLDPDNELEIVRIKTYTQEIISATPTPTNYIMTIQDLNNYKMDDPHEDLNTPLS